MSAGLAELHLGRSPTAWIRCGLWSVLYALVVTASLAVAAEALMFLSVFIRGHPLGYGWNGFAASRAGRVTAREDPPLPASRYETLEVKAAAVLNRIEPRIALGAARMLYG